MMETILISHLTLHPCCLTSLLLSPLQPSIYLTRPAVTPLASACLTDHVMDDTAAQLSCPEDPSLEKAAVLEVPPPPGPQRSSRIRRPPARFLDYDTAL